MSAALPSLAVPGQRLGPTSTYAAGPGTHIQDAFICASIAGPVVVDPAKDKTKAKSLITVSRNYTGSTLPTGSQVNGVSGFGIKPGASTSSTATGAPSKGKLRYNTLPAVDSIVLARVTRVQKRQATVSILVVLDDTATAENAHPSATASDNDNIASILASPANLENQNNSDELRFQALIRKEDVRAVEKDRVVMEEMFRVGDIVRGKVISLGDQSFYYLTTARNDLGIVMARSEAGNMMFPVSWREMRDPITGVGEPRKVARPF